MTEFDPQTIPQAWGTYDDAERLRRWITGDDTLAPLVLVQRRREAVPSPIPPARTAKAAVPDRPPKQYTTPSAATQLGAMYQPMSVSQDQRCFPVPGSIPKIRPLIASTSSVPPDSVFTTIGVFHDSRTPGSRQRSVPVVKLRVRMPVAVSSSV